MKPSPSGSSPVCPPCELHALALTEGQRVRIGGRLIHKQGPLVTLADALTTAQVRLAEEVNLAVGVWLVIDATYRPAEIAVRYVEGKLAGPASPRCCASIINDVSPPPSAPREFRRGTEIGAHLGARAHALTSIREYFSGERFLEVTTPHRVPAPGTDVYIDPQPSAEQWLITSPEFHMKRLLVAGFPKIFQLAQCHRRGEVGAWHQPEFTLLEWYRAFAGHDDVLADTEVLVRALARELDRAGAKRSDAALIETGSLKARSLLASTTPDHIRLDLPFARLSVTEAFSRFADGASACELAESDEDRYFQLMVDAVEPALAAFDTPVFLTEYPISQAALARPTPGKPRTAERFELFIAGIEICNGYGELTDPSAQRSRFERDGETRRAKGMAELPTDEAFLSALDEGMPPSGGNALGLERLLALLLAVPLRDVMAFPAPY